MTTANDSDDEERTMDGKRDGKSSGSGGRYSHGPGHGGPAKGSGNGSPRAPAFGPGNPSRMAHGARSPRVYAEAARTLTEGLLAERPDLAAYPEAVASWAEAEARVTLLRAWLAERDLLDDDGLVERTESPLRLLSRLERQAREGRRDLGLDPKADAELTKARAEATRQVADLDAIRAVGERALSERRLVEVLGTEPEPDGRDDG